MPYGRGHARRARNEPPADSAQVVIVGGGFAGFYAARHLRRTLGDLARITLISPTDYLLYSPLLPEVATGVLDPRDIAVPLRQAVPGVHQVHGRVVAADLQARTVEVESPDAGAFDVAYDRLVLAPGAVTREFDTPGVADHAHGLKTLQEAAFLRNHLLAQLDRADALPDTEEGRRERLERLTVVAVGAGYTGSEYVAQAQHLLRGIAERWTSVDPDDVRWVLVDIAAQVLPELGPALGRSALRVLARRGVEVRLQTTVTAVTSTSVTLSDGTVIPTRTLVWSAGVAPSPLIAQLGLPTSHGRLVVGTDLAVPGVDDVWAAGDAAAVPDTTMPVTSGQEQPLTAPTAQHAERQGATLARNVAASLGHGTPRHYRHHDLGLVADFGGTAAVARPLGVPLTGAIAKVVARGYHLYALPTTSAKIRVATDWLYASVLPTRVVQLDNVRAEDALIERAQATGIYD
ncbi:NAD(P)/FAD-dependent oxidoreductase [Jatrophihabitans sp. YIM 134969]